MRLRALPRFTPWKGEWLDTRRLGMLFDRTSFSMALQFLSDATAQEFATARTDREALEALEFTIRAEDIRLGDALALMLLPHGFGIYETTGGVLVVAKR